MNVRLLTASASHFAAKRLLGPFWMRRKWLEKTQWYDQERLRQIQLDRLQKLVRHCYETVPYYRNLMDKRHIAPESIRTLQDIRRFPVLSKQDVLAAADSLISTRYPAWSLHRAYTGGTTGMPMRIYRNLWSIGTEHAFVRRQWDWAQIGFMDKCTYLRGGIVAASDDARGSLCRYDPIMKELHLSTYHLTPETVPVYMQAMEKYRVVALAGYPSAISFFARACLARKRSFPMKAVLTSSEALTASMREQISKAFACPVYDYYGSAERVCYIFTCGEGCYHIQPEYGYTELIPVDGADGDKCRIVSTGFWNTAMPLIRYDTGDLAVKSNRLCACGRAFPVVEEVTGREGDVIKTPSGEEFGVTIMIHLLYVVCGAANMLETQFVQDAPDHITVKYVPDENFSAAAFSEAQTKFIAHLPRDITIDFERVKAVQRTSSGKIRPVISLCLAEAGEGALSLAASETEVCESV